MTPLLASVAMALRELQRRVGVVALADADADRSRPAYHFCFEALPLPFLRGQHAGDSPSMSMPVRLPKPNCVMKPRDVVDAQVVGEP